MSIKIKQLRHQINVVNNALEVKGIKKCFRMEKRYNYFALELAESSEATCGRTMKTGTKRELYNYLNACDDMIWILNNIY